VFVSINNNVYVTAQSLNSIFIWLEGSNTPIWNISNGLNTPYGIFVIINGDIYVDNGNVNHQVDRWSWYPESVVAVMNVTSRCFSLFVDIINNLYCSLDEEHEVIKISLNSGSNTVIIAAGTAGVAGSQIDMLNTPHGIFVDTNFNLYVADWGNNRIQLFPSGQLNGTTVVSNETLGSIPLTGPNGVVLDADGYLFIVDGGGHIIRSGPSGSQCLVGCTGIMGSASNQLNNPHGISFDSYGNFFIVDTGNNRIQKFFLATNSCGKYTTLRSLLQDTCIFVVDSR
jgi:streptogramin lyase